MRTIVVPFHIDDLVRDLDLPFAADVTVIPQLPRTGPWEDVAALYDVAAVEVAAAASRRRRTGRHFGRLHDVARDGRRAPACPHRARDCVARCPWRRSDIPVLQKTTASGYLGGMPLGLLGATGPSCWRLRGVAAQRTVWVVDAGFTSKDSRNRCAKAPHMNRTRFGR